MKITVLTENVSNKKELKAEKGLSLYIQTENHNIVFDFGKDGAMVENMRALSILPEAADIGILSHGHNDHGGGILPFLQANRRAVIFVRENVFQDFYSKGAIFYKNISLPKRLKNFRRLIRTRNYYSFKDNSMVLFSGVSNEECPSPANNHLFVKEGKKYILDDFSHEMYLLIKENKKTFLFCGCAHNGILNIVKRAEKLAGGHLDAVIGGFHLSSHGGKNSVPDELIKEIAEKLPKETKYYTCHCTGNHAYTILKETLGENITYLSTGDVLDL